MEKTLSQLTDEVVTIYGTYESTGTAPWTYATAVHDLPYQIGSLSKLVMQLHGERHAEGLNVDALHGKIGDELADIIAEVLFIAEQLNIDLAAAWQTMLASDQDKISARAR